MNCHPFDFAPLNCARDKQDKSEPEPFDLAQGRLHGGEESRCFNCRMLFNKKTRFFVASLLRMTLTHHDHVDIVLDNPRIILSNKLLQTTRRFNPRS